MEIDNCIKYIYIYIYLIQFKLENEKEHGERPKITWVKVTTTKMLIEKVIKSAYESTN